MKYSKLFFLSSLMAFGSTRAIGSDSCIGAIAKTFEVRSVVPATADQIARASTTLGGPLSAKKEAGLKKAIEVTNGDIYSASEIANQNKILKKTGFSDTEIQSLRKQHILADSVLSLGNGSPTGIMRSQVALENLSSATIRDLRSGKRFSYVIGENGELFASKDVVDFPSSQVMLASLPGGSEVGAAGSFPVREAGELFYDPATKNFNFRPTYGSDSSELASNSVLAAARRQMQNVDIKYIENPSIAPSRVVKCLDMISAQSSGKNFVMDRMVSDNAVTTIAIGSSEVAGAARLQTDDGRKVIESDIVGGNVNGVIGAVVGKRLTVGNTHFASQMAVRAGMGLGMIEVQKNVTKQMVGGDANQTTASDIAKFNRAHFAARLPINYALDQFMVNSLPTMIFNTCQKHPTLSLAVSPKAVRFYERYASSTIYYGLRQKIVGN